MANLYDKDFCAWATQQAALLRSGKLSEAVIEHIAEEIDSMGRTEKRELADHLEDNPGLKFTLDQAIHDAYRLAIIGAARETDTKIETFPRVCPWSFDQMMNDEFWPERG